MIPLVFELWGRLRENMRPVELGNFPTAVERMTALEHALSQEGARPGPLYVKRDDLSSSVYGGNKVRTLEVLMGLACGAGARQIVATGAFGSNHAVATVLHARRVGLEPEVILFPQPMSWAALENARISATHAAHVSALRHWSALPYAMWRARRARRYVMAPGGAVPQGALGYVAAGLELAAQVQAGELPAPTHVYVGVGSTCTSAGLLVGFRQAQEVGLWAAAPTLVSVRVTPWPVTSHYRILSLAERTSALLTQLSGGVARRISARELRHSLIIDGSQLGRGYGLPSPAGARATAFLAGLSDLRLDTTYSEKSMAGFLRAARSGHAGPLLYWATKSSAALPAPADLALAPISAAFRRWLRQASTLEPGRTE